MILCKIADYSSECGERCCCLVCDKKTVCETLCEYIHKGEIVEPSQCENAYGEDDKLVVIKNKISPVMQAIVNITTQKKSLDEEEKKLRQALLEAMEKYDIKSFEDEHVRLVYVAPTTRTTIDTKALKAEMPNVAAKYAKTSDVAASVKITVK